VKPRKTSQKNIHGNQPGKKQQHTAQEEVSAPANDPEHTREKERMVTNQDEQEIITNKDAGKIPGSGDSEAG
jgi:hypothetical protein